MLARLLTFRQARPLAYLLAILGAGIVFLLTAQSAFAANTISTSKYEESGTADGTLDRIRFAMDENVTACTYESGDWSIDAAGTVGLTAITAVSCTTLDVNLDITATFTANITGGAVNPQIDYNNQGQPNSIYLTSGAMTNKLNQAITDGAKPQANAFTYADNDGDGKIDRVTITWSEEVAAGSVIAKNDLTFQNVGDFTGIAFGTDNTDLITGSTSTTLLDLTAGAGAAEATALDTADSGSIRIDSQNAWSITDGTNANTTLGSQSAIATYTDGAKPVISTFDYSDADDDGKVDTITVNYTETVTAASVLAANDLTLSAVGDFTSLAFGANSTDLITGSVTSTAITLGTESTVKDTEDNAGTLAITSQNLFSLTDGTNTNADLEAQAQATAVDEAKPVITAFDYQDADDDGKIDTIVTNFSEEVVAGSVLRPADLTFSAVGDFTAAAFGANTTDAITGTVTSATLTLGTESTAKDTAEGAGTIAITAQNNFSLVDTATAANTNNTLDAQSSSATFVDEAAPQIATVTYSDADGDAKVDTLTLAYTETVTAASVLGQNDLTLSAVGDFTALAFSNSATDLITGSVSSTAITMGTESSAQDTGDDSPALAMTSQNLFSLTDGTNANAELEAQMSSSATVADGARPMLLTTSPVNGATGVSATANTVLTFSEPISTGSFTWTSTGGPAMADFAAAWTVGDTVVTLNPPGNMGGGLHTVDVTAAPDTGSNTYNGAVAAIADPFTFTVSTSGTTSTGTSSTVGGSANYSVLVEAPNGGETLTPGESYDIRWSTDGGSTMSAMNIAYSTNNGDSYTAIVSDTANDGSYTWTVPDIDSDQVFIRIQGTDLATVLAYDRSDSEFTIGTVAASDDEDTTDEDEDTSSDDSDTAETSDDVTVPSSGETGASPVTGETEEISAVEAGMYVRSVYFDTVYYLEGQDDGSIVRRPFMDSQTYFTYFDSWDEVETVTDATLPTLTLGAPMLPQAGVVLVKIQSVAKVYAIEGDGELRWVTSESVAEEIYGEDWADYVIDIPDTLWPRFDQGDDIDSDEGFDTSNMKTRMEVNS